MSDQPTARAIARNASCARARDSNTPPVPLLVVVVGGGALTTGGEEAASLSLSFFSSLSFLTASPSNRGHGEVEQPTFTLGHGIEEAQDAVEAKPPATESACSQVSPQSRAAEDDDDDWACD